MSHVDFIQKSLELAKFASAAGEIPVGALLVKDGKVLAEAFNTREDSGSPLDHAEIRVLQEAASKLGDWRLSGCTLYVSLEPCPMCLGALMQARVAELVFGAFDPKRAGNSHFPSFRNEISDPESPVIVESNNHKLKVWGGIMAEEAGQLLKDFFREKRG